MTREEKVEKINKLHEKWNNRDIVSSLTQELSFEISESEYSLEQIIRAVEQEYPAYKFNRCEPRYESCIMAIFEKRYY